MMRSPCITHLHSWLIDRGLPLHASRQGLPPQGQKPVPLPRIERERARSHGLQEAIPGSAVSDAFSITASTMDFPVLDCNGRNVS